MVTGMPTKCEASTNYRSKSTVGSSERLLALGYISCVYMAHSNNGLKICCWPERMFEPQPGRGGRALEIHQTKKRLLCSQNIHDGSQKNQTAFLTGWYNNHRTIVPGFGGQVLQRTNCLVPRYHKKVSPLQHTRFWPVLPSTVVCCIIPNLLKEAIIPSCPGFGSKSWTSPSLGIVAEQSPLASKGLNDGCRNIFCVSFPLC